MYIESFKDLIVWQNAMLLAIKIQKNYFDYYQKNRFT
jgi:hypothetical protein